MRNDRRKFIAGTALLLGGAATGGIGWLRGSSGTGPRNRAEREVFSAVGSYGSTVAVQREGDSGEHVVLKVRLNDQEAFMKVYQQRQGLPADLVVRADGNDLSFAHRGTSFSVQHELSAI